MAQPSTSLTKKRVHIAGLTPALTPSDLISRFSSFGVSSHNPSGFGATDANGQLKTFAYLTLEGTDESVQKCMRGVSGAVWKGAKLRVGDAKPDFQERIRKEKEESTTNQKEKRPSKRRRLAIHAKDLEPVTLTTASSHPGWKTNDENLIRPMRMRPSKPLLPRTLFDTSKRGKKKEQPTKRVRDPPSRMRRKTIDPRMWGHVHLRGEQLAGGMEGLESGVGASAFAAAAAEKKKEKEREKAKKKEEKKNKKKTLESLGTVKVAPAPPIPVPVPAPVPVPISAPLNPPHEATSFNTTAGNAEMDLDTAIAEEKSAALNLLRSMFGEDTGEWGRKEYVNSDEEECELPKGAIQDETKEQETDEEGEWEDEEEEEEGEVEGQSPSPEPSPQDANTKPKQSLKDMFKPQPEEGFSLFGDMGLDLELDPAMDDLLFGSSNAPATNAQTPAPAPIHVPVPLQNNLKKHTETFTLDTSLPFFFPCPSNPSKDITSILESQLPPGEKFYRTETSEEIRERWNKVKGDLTRDWKKRHREAVKLKRVRTGQRGND